MKSRIALVCIALLAVFFVACPIPQVGVGTSKDAMGGSENNSQGSTAGSISVVNDEARNQAVYINEAGQRFDVVAEEYPGGPLVRCVQMVDFTELEPSTDADALLVKAIVAGTRDDGTPGVWEIHSDDSILLPQPEQTDDNTARCIIGGDITTLPDGLQVRLGWLFKVTDVSDDGKIIVGVTKHPKGFTYNTTEVLATSSVAVYWRVYKLPYSRFLIVSPPHVIGVVTNPKRPAGWAPHDWNLSSVLSHLRQFFLGRFDSYLTTADNVSYDTAEAVYKVKGLDDLNLAATARIDKTTVESVIEAPDLTVGNVMFSPATADVTRTLSLSAEVKNLTFDGARPGMLQFFLNDTPIAQTDTPTITADGSTGPIKVEASLAGHGAGSYTVSAKVIANSQDGEVVTDNNTAVALDSVTGLPAVFTIPESADTHPDLAIESVKPDAATVALAGGVWPFTVVVKNYGDTDSADSVLLHYQVVNANGGTPVKLSVKVLPLGPNATFTDTLNDLTDKRLSALGITSGINSITVSVDAVNETDTAQANNTWASSVTLTVVTHPDLAIFSVERLPPVDHEIGAYGTAEEWPFTVVVKNVGDANSAESVLLHYQVVNANGGTPVDLWVKVHALAPNATFTDTLTDYADKHLGKYLDAGGTERPGLGITSGTNTITVSVDAVNETDTAQANNKWASPVKLLVKYPELVIDTYYPTDPDGRDLEHSFTIELWVPGETIARRTDSGSARPGDFPNVYYPYIDYTDGLAPGDYYVRVTAANPKDSIAYAIRVLTAPNSSYGLIDPNDSTKGKWTFDQPASETISDQPQQLTDGPNTSDPSPYKTMTVSDPLNDHLNRFIVAGGVNWTRIHLP